MNGVVERVTERVGPLCLVHGTLKEQDCHLYVDELPQNHVSINLEHPSAPTDLTKFHCDFIILVENDNADAWAVPIEMKRGGFNSRSVARQLQGGITLLESWLPKQDNVSILAVLVSGKFPKNERTRFRKQKVRFRGIEYPLKRLKCGDSLRSILRS